MDKATTFTIEVQGLSLPQQQQDRISKALNERFIELLGEVDLRSSGMKTEGAAVGGGSLIYKFGPKGGRLLSVQSKALTDLVQQLEKQGNLGTEPGNLVIMGHAG